MGELSGILLTGLVLVAALSGCLKKDEPIIESPDARPPVEVEISGSKCEGARISALVDSEAVQPKVPQVFPIVKQPVTNYATINATFIACEQGRILDLSSGLNLWLVEVLVDPPAWAREGASASFTNFHYVLGMYSRLPNFTQAMQIVNITVLDGEVTRIVNNRVSAVDDHGPMTVAPFATPLEARGATTRHIFSQTNGTYGKWDVRDVARAGSSGQYQAQGASGSFWDDLAGDALLVNGFISTTYEVQPSRFAFLGPADGTA
jgi:hypothetical protein